MSVKQMSIVWELDLAPNKRLVLLAYADHADEDGNNVFPSLPRIAHKTGYSTDQVRRLTKELTEAKLMELVGEGRGRGNTNEYKLTLEKGSKLPPFESKPKNLANDTENLAPRTENLAPVQPEPSEPPENHHPPGGEASTEDAPPEPVEEERTTAGDFVAFIYEELEGVTPPILRNRRGRLGKDFSEYLGAKTDEEVLWKAAKWIIARWRGQYGDHAKLSVEMAVEDVVNNKAFSGPEEGYKKANQNGGAKAGGNNVSSITPGAGVATPPAGIGALEASSDLRRYAQYAYKHDFSANGGDEQPPWPVYANLGGDDDERQTNLNRIRSVVRRGIKEAEQGDNLRPLMHYYQAFLHLALEPTTVGEVLHKAEEEGWGHQKVMAYIEERFGGRDG